VFSLDRFEFDGNFLSRYDIGPKVDVTKAATSDFASDAVFVPNAKILERYMSARILEAGAAVGGAVGVMNDNV
jgi:hypothetical protein